MLRIPDLPVVPGAYRWLYADAHCGAYTVVCIFMIGALFSPRYARGARRGAPPVAHCAVNCALHRHGRRLAWVFTERPGAAVDAARRALRIGASTWRYAEDGSVAIEIDERTAPWGRPVALSLRLVPTAPAGPELSLDETGVHRWQPLAARAAATLTLRGRASVPGIGYHDTNHGPEPLGPRLPRWTWSRVHAGDHTAIRYRPPAPVPALDVLATAARVEVERRVLPAEPLRRSRWGLGIPDAIRAGDRAIAVDALLESSPFYARQTGAAAGAIGMAEVADFRRFHAPLVRWMANARLRVEAG